MESVEIRVNSEPMTVPADTSLADLVAAACGRPDPAGVAIALNGRVVPRSAWGRHRVAAADDVEIVRAVQGG